MVRKPPRGVRESEIPCPGNAGLLSHRRRLQAADVDLLSGHRVGLDVGIDRNYVEYQAGPSGGTSVPARPAGGTDPAPPPVVHPIRRRLPRPLPPGRPSALAPKPAPQPDLGRRDPAKQRSTGPTDSRTTRTAGAGRDGRQLLGSRSWVVRLRWKNWRLFTPARVRGFVCKNVRRMSTTIRIYPDLTVVA